MKFDDDADLDASQVDDRRGERGRTRGSGGFGTGGFRVPTGSGGSTGGTSTGTASGPGARKSGNILGLIILVVILVVVVRAVTSGSKGGSSASGTAPTSQTRTCTKGADANSRQDCRIVALTNSIQSFWDGAFADDNRRYREAQVVLFDGSTDSECGRADASVGPFYCQTDQRIYVDLSFFRELQDRFGTRGGDFAEAYVLAHEFGHHVQNLVLGEVSATGSEAQGADSRSVRLELQADCYAGVWAHHATTGPKPLITELTSTDIREGIDAAQAVGDDSIQRDNGERINQDTWTHGSAAQRRDWFQTGLDRGRIGDCDTLSASRL